MEPASSEIVPLHQLFLESGRPLYAVDSHRQIIFGNRALVDWLSLDLQKIVGRHVAYHSETAEPLSGLSPPPATFSGKRCQGTISCLTREGRLQHRRAEFLPLDPASETGVLVMVDSDNLSAVELAEELAEDPTADSLHRAIRQFRRARGAECATETLLGNSPAMGKVRAQVDAAIASGAHVLLQGPCGSGREQIAHAIHYGSIARKNEPDRAGKLLPLDCEIATVELVERTIQLFHRAGREISGNTLLLKNVDRLSNDLQTELVRLFADKGFPARIVATMSPEKERKTSHLVDLVSTITIDLPRLTDRLDDLPWLAQCFLESCNRDNPKQIGGLRAEALDRMALYGWPGELDELREVVAKAHQACTGHEILSGDLPVVIHHAVSSAKLPQQPSQKILLDDLLTEIEKKLLCRALDQAAGNKAEAARNLGITRPRLYRRMVQLGLTGEQPS